MSLCKKGNKISIKSFANQWCLPTNFTMWTPDLVTTSFAESCLNHEASSIETFHIQPCYHQTMTLFTQGVIQTGIFGAFHNCCCSCPNLLEMCLKKEREYKKMNREKSPLSFIPLTSFISCEYHTVATILDLTGERKKKRMNQCNRAKMTVESSAAAWLSATLCATTVCELWSTHSHYCVVTGTASPTRLDNEVS